MLIPSIGSWVKEVSSFFTTFLMLFKGFILTMTFSLFWRSMPLILGSKSYIFESWILGIVSLFEIGISLNFSFLMELTGIPNYLKIESVSLSSIRLGFNYTKFVIFSFNSYNNGKWLRGLSPWKTYRESHKWIGSDHQRCL